MSIGCTEISSFAIGDVAATLQWEVAFTMLMCSNGTALLVTVRYYYHLMLPSNVLLCKKLVFVPKGPVDPWTKGDVM